MQVSREIEDVVRGPAHYRCSICDLDGVVVIENDHCLFLQEPQQVLIGSGIIVPRAHRPTLFDLSEAEWVATYLLLQRAKALLDATHLPHGYNIGWNAGRVAGQEIFHSHLHVIPRFEDEPLAGKGIRHWLKQPDNKRPG
jgi:diadenosine tetraphosphate (Ap4A) HIT family hydrolase